MPATLNTPRAPGAPRAARTPRIPDGRELNPPSNPSGPSSPPSPAQEDRKDGLTSHQSLASAIMFDYLTLSLPLPGLAARHNLSPAALADIIESPEFQHLLDRLNTIAAQRAGHIAVHARSESIAALQTIVATSVDPELTRKASTTLLRASDRILYPPRQSRKRSQSELGAATSSADEATTGASRRGLVNSESLPETSPQRESLLRHGCKGCARAQLRPH